MKYEGPLWTNQDFNGMSFQGFGTFPKNPIKTPQKWRSFLRTKKTPLRFIQARSPFHWRVHPGILRVAKKIHQQTNPRKTGVCHFITWNNPKKLEKPWITKGYKGSKPSFLKFRFLVRSRGLDGPVGSETISRVSKNPLQQNRELRINGEPRG